MPFLRLGELVDFDLFRRPLIRDRLSFMGVFDLGLHDSNPEKDPLKAGKVPEVWKEKPTKLAQKHRDARWTMKRGQHRVRANLCRQGLSRP